MRNHNVTVLTPALLQFITDASLGVVAGCERFPRCYVDVTIDATHKDCFVFIAASCRTVDTLHGEHNMVEKLVISRYEGESQYTVGPFSREDSRLILATMMAEREKEAVIARNLNMAQWAKNSEKWC